MGAFDVDVYADGTSQETVVVVQGPRCSMTTEERISNARAAKADKLAAWLIQRGWSVEHVRAIPPETWVEIAKLAGTRPPGSQVTVNLIVQIMEDKDKNESTTA